MLLKELIRGNLDYFDHVQNHLQIDGNLKKSLTKLEKHQRNYNNYKSKRNKDG